MTPGSPITSGYYLGDEPRYGMDEDVSSFWTGNCEESCPSAHLWSFTSKFFNDSHPFSWVLNTSYMTFHRCFASFFMVSHLFFIDSP